MFSRKGAYIQEMSHAHFYLSLEAYREPSQNINNCWIVWLEFTLKMSKKSLLQQHMEFSWLNNK